MVVFSQDRTQADGKRVWEWSAIEEDFVDNEKLEIESLYSQGKKQKKVDHRVSMYFP